MARPKTEFDERDLFEWFGTNVNTEKLWMQRGKQRPDSRLRERRRVTIWQMNQFDIRILTLALEGKPLPKYLSRNHDPKTWDLYRVVTETTKLAECKEPGIRERAIHKIRKWHTIAASMHEDFQAERGLVATPSGEVDDRITEPDASDAEDLNDGLIPE